MHASPIKGCHPLPRAHERHRLALLCHQPPVERRRRDSGPARRWCPHHPNLLPRPPKSSPRCPFACPDRELAGTGGAAAGTSRRHRTTPPAPPPPQTPVEIEPWDPTGHPLPAPGLSRPPVRRNLAGPPPAGARGPHCEGPSLSEGLSAN
jgi:hypothetical protein